MRPSVVSSLRSLALDICALGFSLALGLLGMAKLFASEIPNHHTATSCVYASIVIGYLALAAGAIFIAVPEPGEQRVPLPSARLRRH